MSENDLENTEKKEYSITENYNQSLSRPNLNLNSTLGINMQNLDSKNIGSRRNRDRILQDEPEKSKKKEEPVPEISEIYGDNSNYKEEISKEENKHKIGELNTNKIAPENMVAIITTVLIVIFMVLSIILYNLFTR